MTVRSRLHDATMSASAVGARSSFHDTAPGAAVATDVAVAVEAREKERRVSKDRWDAFAG